MEHIKKYRKIFISCPFNKYLKEGIISDPTYCQFTQRIYSFCSEVSDNVFMALKREDYGRRPLKEYSISIDYSEIESSDLILSLPQDSLGVAVELGWASALHKKIVLVLDEDTPNVEQVISIDMITDCQVIFYKNNILDAIPLIISTINNA